MEFLSRSWKVMKFDYLDSRAGKSWNFRPGHGKSFLLFTVALLLLLSYFFLLVYIAVLDSLNLYRMSNNNTDFQVKPHA